MKNWQPSVLGPLFAMKSRPGAMSKLKIFIFKLPSENIGNSSTICINKISILKSFMTLWKVLPLYLIGTPSFMNSPFQNCLKFLAILGTTSPKRSIFMWPTSYNQREMVRRSSSSPWGLLQWLRWQRIRLQCRRPGFDPWVGKIPWRREWQPTPVFLPGKSHGQRNLEDYSQ